MKKISKITLGMIIVFALGLVYFSGNILADTAEGNVTILNSAPTIGTVTLWNQAGDDDVVTLSVEGVVITANATVTDPNGGGDISSASATLFHSTSTSDGADDENIHITNSSCELSAPSGNDVVVTCSFMMNYMALPGTWTVKINAVDNSSADVNGTDDNTVNELVGLEVVEPTINFGSLELGANSSTGTSMNIRNMGNIQINSQYSGSDYTCTVGTIPVGNTKYSLTNDAYDSLTTDLTAEDVTQADFNLGVRGVATADGADSDENEYWGIQIPTSGVSGTCLNTLTVTAIAD